MTDPEYKSKLKSYSYDELLDIEAHIDKEEHPSRYRDVIVEIKDRPKPTTSFEPIYPFRDEPFNFKAIRILICIAVPIILITLLLIQRHNPNKLNINVILFGILSPICLMEGISSLYTNQGTLRGGFKFNRNDNPIVFWFTVAFEIIIGVAGIIYSLTILQ